MLFKLQLLLIVGLGLGFAFANPLQETNAQRLARGLPPSPPKFVRATAAKRGPTPASNARRSATSPLPPVTLTGKLQVRRKDGSNAGNVRNWPGGGTISGTSAFSPDGDLLVTLTYNPSDPTHIDILSTNPAFPAPFYVGAGTFSTLVTPTLSVGSRNNIPFTNVEQTSPGSTPVTPATRDAFVESAIWIIDPATRQLTAQWVNPDGSLPPTIFAYDLRNNALFFTGDVSAYNNNNPFPADAVDLFLL